MGRLLRLALYGLLGLILCVAGVAGLVYWDLPDVAVLKDRRASLTITVRDWQGQEHPFVVGPKNRSWVPLSALPAEMKWAVIVAEDANFYEHRGIDVQALKEALQYDLEQKRLARGASTITQQLAKNLFLSREKTLLRKLREAVLARRMEEALSKGRILELYLNVVELGPLVHGVGRGARYHFDKSALELTPAECAFLAAILPGPRLAYNPERRPEKVKRRAERIVHLLRLRGVLDPAGEALALERLTRLREPPEAAPAISESQPESTAAPATDAAPTTSVPLPDTGAPTTSNEAVPGEAPPVAAPDAVPPPLPPPAAAPQ